MWPETLKITKAELSNRERIDMLIHVLEKETTQQSIAKLDEYNMYVWGVEWLFYQDDSYGIKAIPLETGKGQKDVICIMANRRFVKLIEELSKLPKATAAVLIKNQIAKTLPVYRKLWDEFIEGSNFGKKAKYKDPEKRNRPMSSYKTHGRPTLLGSRFKILALLAIAGNLQLQETHAAVVEVMDFAIEQRNELYDDPTYSKSAAAYILVEGSLYSRQLLATALMGTSLDLSDQQQIGKSVNAEIKTVKLQPYTAVVTRYGRLSPEYEIMKDPTTGTLPFRYVSPISDSQFEQIIKAVAGTQE
jgi:hypothetical protein